MSKVGRGRLLLLFGLVVWTLLFCTRPAHAYLDPSSGSLMLQALLGGLAAMGMLARVAWGRVRDRLGRVSIGSPGNRAA